MSGEKTPLPAPLKGEGEDWDPRKSEREVTLRRWKRRLKAAASIGLAVAAGTYLACQKTAPLRQRPAPNPSTPEVHDLPAPSPAPPDMPRTRDVKDMKTRETQIDLRHPEEHHKKGQLDREEHRKGMPVRDNLLE